jgi:glyoxylase-like metal-dependent hydrolase (beta-lactamase superfamily II)
VVVGGVELVPLVDAVGVFGPLVEFYPEWELEEWRRYRSQYPQLFAGDSWRMTHSCYLIRSAGTTVLVDTGVGPPGLWNWEPEWEGGLLPALEREGIAPTDVDTVLLTHVHVDHVGWNADAAGAPIFAHFVLHEDALAAARERADRSHIPRCILGIEDRMETFVGEAQVAPGVTVVELPGHDAGHVGVRIGDGAFLITDAAPHPAALDRPDLRFRYDLDPEAVAATRGRLLAELADRDVLTVCGHYPEGGIGRIVTRDGHAVWESV